MHLAGSCHHTHADHGLPRVPAGNGIPLFSVNYFGRPCCLLSPSSNDTGHAATPQHAARVSRWVRRSRAPPSRSGLLASAAIAVAAAAFRARLAGQAPPFGAADLAAVLATCHRPRPRGRGLESDAVAAERGRLDAVIAGLLFMAGMRRSEVSTLRCAGPTSPTRPPATSSSSPCAGARRTRRARFCLNSSAASRSPVSRTARYSFMAPEEAPATRRYRRYRVFPHDSCRYPSYRGACAAKLQALGWTLGEARQRAAQVVPDPPTGDQGDDDGDPDGIVTLDKLGAVEVDTIARGLFFRDKLGVLHGKGGSGKTTVVAGALAAITTGADWLGAPTVEGDVLIVGAEDVDTFRARIAEWGGDLARVHVWERSNLDRLPAVLAKVAPVAVVFDSLQTVAHAAGVNSNSSDEAANIMRPMVAARKGSGAGCGQVKSGHLWTPQIRPFPAPRDGS